jgi:hypothetical protein
MSDYLFISNLHVEKGVEGRTEMRVPQENNYHRMCFERWFALNEISTILFKQD